VQGIAETKGALQSLSALLEFELLSSAARSNGRGASGSPEQQLALIDANISKLSAKITNLETELSNAKSELHSARMRRDSVAKSSAASNGKAMVGSSASQVAAQALVERLQGQLTLADEGDDVARDAGVTLKKLLEASLAAAKLHLANVGRVGEQLGFARSRLLSAANLGDPARERTAREMVADCKKQAQATQESLGGLESVVTGLERDIVGRGGELRGLSEQVKAQVLLVYESCRELLDGEHAESVLGGAVGKRALTMEEILAMKVQSGGRGSRGGGAAAAAAATVGDIAVPAPDSVPTQLRPQQPRVPVAAAVPSPQPLSQRQPQLLPQQQVQQVAHVQIAVPQSAPMSAGRSFSAALIGRAAPTAPTAPAYSGMGPAPVYAAMPPAPMVPMVGVPIAVDASAISGIDVAPPPHAVPATAMMPAAARAPNAALATAEEVAERLRHSFPAPPGGAGPVPQGGRRSSGRPGGGRGSRAARA
jgi:hypothetical protein